MVTLDTVKTTTFTAADQLAMRAKPFNINLVECDTATRKISSNFIQWANC
ncbi:hypothetical protein AB6G80_19530 [Providencia hangzhouensis]